MIVVRTESKQDYTIVHSIHQLAFQQDHEALLVAALRKSTAFIPELSLVAVAGNKVTGHILFTKVLIRSETSMYESLALAPVAVAPGYQQKGIGNCLIRTGLQKATGLGYGSVIVLGHPGYYPKFGFRAAETWQIKAPFVVPSDAFMALELYPGALENVSGTVEYAPEFGIS